MIKIKDYPLFIPPVEVSSKQPKDWTSNEAKLYFKWFISLKDDRVEYLMTVLDEELTDDIEADLRRIGEKVSVALHKPLFSEEHLGAANSITNQGLALAADMALLVAQLIIRKHSQIKWKVVTRPKSDISFQLPALFSFPKIGHIETMAGSIANAKAILRGEETSDIWWRMFKYADDLLV